MSCPVILHTSDWHLGHQLYRRRRDEEFEYFLQWLTDTIVERHVDHIIIAGDVFDTGVPGPTAQRLYYQFLARANQAGARSITITAGNHDSPLFLTAPGSLLKALKINIIGAPSDNVEDEIILLPDRSGAPEAIICAVPYLRERDMRKAVPGESIDEREHSLAEGISEHYRQIALKAEKLRREIGRNIPIIATGHLFTTGATTGDGVRELYIGALGRLPHSIFPAAFDYVALGHIHKPQKVGGSEFIRYSGSPLPMSFAEADQAKSSVLVHFDGHCASVELLQTPQFRKFQTLRGSREAILQNLEQLIGQCEPGSDAIWLELEHDGTDAIGDLNQRAKELVSGYPLEILCVKPAPQAASSLAKTIGRSLEEYAPEEMFGQRLAQAGYTEETGADLMASFKELLALWHKGQEGE